MRWSWKVEDKVSLFSIILCGVLAFFHVLLSANQTSYANGWDGYYYVMQAHSWLTYGHLQSIDYSLIYPFFISIDWLVGDYILGHKLGVSLLSVILVVVAFRFTYKISNRSKASILVAAYLIFSPTFNYFVIQFPKNALGLIFLLQILISIHESNKLKIMLFLCLGFLTHRMVGFIGLTVFVVYLVNKLNWKWLLLGVVVISVASLLPGILHFSDFERLNGQLSITPQFAVISFYSLFKESMDFWWLLDLGLIAFATIYLLFHYIKYSEFQAQDILTRGVLPLIVLFCVFPFFKFESGSIGYRIFLIAPSLFFAIVITKLKPSDRLVGILSLFFIIASGFSYKSYNPKMHDPPNQQFELICNRLDQTYSSEHFPLVIVRKSLAEMVIYKTSFDALNWVPPETFPKKQILRISSNLEYIHFKKYLEAKELNMLKKLTIGYYAMPETIWNQFLNRVISSDDADMLVRIENGANPLERRPQFLLKNKKEEWKK